MKKKMTRITLAIMLGLIVFAQISDILFNSYVSEDGKKMSGYEKMLEERTYGRMLSGRRLDDILLSEMRKAYENEQVLEYKSKTEQSGFYENTHSTIVTGIYIDDGRTAEEIIEGRDRYEEIYSFAAQIVGYVDANSVSEEELYNSRRESIAAQNASQQLTTEEYAYWEKQEAKIESPFLYEYHFSAMRIFIQANFLTYLWIFAIAICLSGVFPEEHLRRTDQLILSSRYGRKTSYLAKLAAGVSFGAGAVMLFYAFSTLVILIIYGADGFHAALQLVLWQSSRALSFGGASLMLFFISLTAALVCSIFTMFLSEGLKNSVATLGIMTGGTLLLFFIRDFPYRTVSQFFKLLPTKLIDDSSFMENRLFGIFGKYFTNFQAGPVLYLLLAAVLAWIGYRMYRGYQVSGR